MSEELTENQARILRFIIDRIEQEGYPPTIREIGREMKIATLKGVTVHLEALEKKRYLRRTHQARGIQILRLPGLPAERKEIPDKSIKISREKLSSGLLEKIKEISGENIFACYQCGKCSAGCPVAEEMEVLPSQVIRLLQLGVEDIRLRKTVWLCASCLTCTSRCPRGVDLSRVMAALREIILRREGDKVNPEEIPRESLEKFPPIALVSGFRKLTG